MIREMIGAVGVGFRGSSHPTRAHFEWRHILVGMGRPREVFLHDRLTGSRVVLLESKK